MHFVLETLDYREALDTQLNQFKKFKYSPAIRLQIIKKTD